LITPRIVRIGETVFLDYMVKGEALEAFEIDAEMFGK
jgi:hypothetical protein